MILGRVEVENVRNIEAAGIDLCPGLNVLSGANGAGKTAFLEAVHLLLRGRSFRTRSIETIIRNGSNGLTIRAEMRNPTRGESKIGLTKDRAKNTQLRRDGVAVTNASEVAALLPVQVLLPDLADLVFGPPLSRRQWLDWGTFHVKHEYLVTLRDYLRAIRQRNSAIRAGDQEAIGLWGEQAGGLGERVTGMRQFYVDLINAQLSSTLEMLSPGLNIALRHEPGWRGDSLAKEMRQHAPRDVKLKSTQAGPHRADVRIEIAPKSTQTAPQPAAQVLSRGQGKVVASAMKLVQAQHLSSAMEKPSLFLIDDAGAELDEEHRDRFFGMLKDQNYQIVATTTNSDGLLGGYPITRAAMFHVEHGHIEPTDQN